MTGMTTKKTEAAAGGEARDPVSGHGAGRHEAATQTTDVAIVGGGPAGAVLAFLLARQGVDVVLLEAQGDFDRDFRGDTIHPAIMELLDQLGLADELLELEHEKVPCVRYLTPGGDPFTIADLGRLRTRFPFLVLMLQSRF